MYNNVLNFIIARFSNVGGFKRVCEVSKYLRTLSLNRGTCQLTEHTYDISMSIFFNDLLIALITS